ncbi:unnamed protein product [Lactuca saligna]|uniref:Uncharacterized protein n=1 Tax=Lactuca saligna TaxID=75948 RepID=A0AA36DZG1_LACSI|nr:unnamed protein product [Lactuca saligna]
MGEGVLHNENQGNTTFVISSSLPTSVLDTTVSLPPYIVPNTSQNPSFSHSPIFGNSIQQPITSLFPSQSPDEPQAVKEDEMDDGGVIGKQFKFLNRKLNSLLQLQANAGGKNLICALDVDVMLQAQEHCILDKLNRMDESAELWIKSQLDSFNSEIHELKETAKSQHILFVQDVKMLLFILPWEVKFDKKAEVDANSFGNVENLVKELKDLFSKYGSSKSSVVSPESFTKIFRMLEATIHDDLAPLAKFVNLMLTNAPPVSKGV